jgi:predicted Rdx family selenoprotein
VCVFRHLRLPVVWWWSPFPPLRFREQAKYKVLGQWKCAQSRGDVTFHPAKCTVWCAISKRVLIGPIFLDGAVTSQRYLQQLQNDVISITQGAGHVDRTFFQ